MTELYLGKPPEPYAIGSAWARAEAAIRVYGHVRIVKTRQYIQAAGVVMAQVLATAEAGMIGRAAVGRGLFSVDAELRGATEVGAKARAAGLAFIGLDSLGLPAIELGAHAGGSAGARAQADAGTRISLLGLLTLRARAVAQAVAGTAGEVTGHLKIRDGDFAVRLGATGSTGVGARVATEVGIALGKIPHGLLATAVAPIVCAPVLLFNSLAKLLGRKDQPDSQAPGLGDFPRVAAGRVSAGAKLIAEGTVDLARDIGKGVRSLAKGLAFVGTSFASFFD